MGLTIRQTLVFARWLRRLRDKEAKLRINNRIRKLAVGLLGDVRPAGKGVSEIRINYGPGYRIYFVQKSKTFVVLLVGGDKDSQRRDIARARELARGI
jgi:putative addiction module killer protein